MPTNKKTIGVVFEQSRCSCLSFAGAAMPEEEMNMAEGKFEESKTLAETAMYNLLENDVRKFEQ